jgi:hypothetical protein
MDRASPADAVDTGSHQVRVRVEAWGAMNTARKSLTLVWVGPVITS